MCGITGLLGLESDAGGIASAMAASLSHRGPDGCRSWSASVTNDVSIGFGHSRLSIVDIVGSNQPIHSDHGCTLIQNGEIYNFSSIRTEQPSYPWRTSGDAEAILAAHSAAIGAALEVPRPLQSSSMVGWVRASVGHGESRNPAQRHVDWISRLDGIWGFALWDARNQELVLSRDPLGVKPLLRTITDSGTLLFASEAKAFCSHPEYTPMLDEAALVARLAFEYSLDDTTLFAGVGQVRPGTVETWRFDSDGRAVLTGVARYSCEEVRPSSHWDSEVEASKLLASLTSSLADRLMSDVPVGIVLSGGLDSSMVAALAHKASQMADKPLPECWTVAESEDNPDWLAAEEVASTLDIPHHQHILAADSFWKALPDLSWYGEDLDLTVLFFQPLFARMAEDVTVGLCGQGADELHGGYPRYQNLAEHRNLIRSRLESVDHPAAQALLAGADVGPAGPAQPWTGSSHIPDDVFADLRTTLQYELDHGQLTNFQLRLVDRHSMAHGLEVRVPFLGTSHREASHRLPIHLRVDQPREKIALRAAANLTTLPKSIVQRPKMPAGRATSPTMIDDLLNELSGHAVEYAGDIPALEPMLKSQPDISIGLRLFRSLHLVDGGIGRYGKDLMALLEDVE